MHKIYANIGASEGKGEGEMHCREAANGGRSRVEAKCFPPVTAAKLEHKNS